MSERKQSNRTRNLLIGCGAALALLCIVSVVAIVFVVPQIHDTVATLDCVMTRYGVESDQRSKDCDQWLKIVKRDHAAEYNECVLNAWNVDDPVMYCFDEKKIDPTTILGH